MRQRGSRSIPGGFGRSGKVGRSARLLGPQLQSAPACDSPQAQCSGFGELSPPRGRGPAARRLFCWPSHPPRVGQVLYARKQREAGQPHWSLAAAGGRSTARGYLRLFL